jgi:hypothetical protein
MAPLKNPIRDLPKLDVSDERLLDVANQIRHALGIQDDHSAHFHRLVASRVPEKIIYAHLADIRADGARNPGALFTYRMTQYAKGQLAASQPSVRDRIEQLTAAKRVL